MHYLLIQCVYILVIFHFKEETMYDICSLFD